MSKQLSFVKYENELIHNFRNKINTSEDIEDVRNIFSYTIIDLFDRIFQGRLGELYTEDVFFEPENDHYFKFSKKIWKNPEFKKIWEESDLPKVVSDFADSAYRRYVHLHKHPEKTEMKIRNNG